MSQIDKSRLSLRAGELYGWTMYPGYSGRPYRSPIRADSISRRHESVFELEFLNFAYAAGVQNMTYLLRALRWEATYLVAEQLRNGSPTDRAVVIEPLDKRWMEENVPRQAANVASLFDSAGRPIAEEFARLIATAW